MPFTATIRQALPTSGPPALPMPPSSRSVYREGLVVAFEDADRGTAWVGHVARGSRHDVAVRVPTAAASS